MHVDMKNSVAYRIYLVLDTIYGIDLLYNVWVAQNCLGSNLSCKISVCDLYEMRK